MAVMLRRFLRGKLCRSSRGATLIEVTIAVVILGLLLASIPPAMMVISRSRFNQTEMRIAESITRSQFEYIKSQDYQWGNATVPSYTGAPLPDFLTTSYGVSQPIAHPIDPEGNPLPPGTDYGVQEIEIVVYGWRYAQGGEEELLRTTNYKVARPDLVVSGYEVNPQVIQ